MDYGENLHGLKGVKAGKICGEKRCIGDSDFIFNLRLFFCKKREKMLDSQKASGTVLWLNSRRCPYRLARSGHWIFIPRTGVRIPVGTPWVRGSEP